MCYLLLKHGSFKIRCFYMCIKMISADVGKSIDVFTGDHSFFGDDLVADLQFFKIFFEWVFARFFACSILLVNICNGSNGCWRSL